MFPLAVTSGNTFVLKLTQDIVNVIRDDDNIKAISFVGSNVAGMHLYNYIQEQQLKGNMFSQYGGQKSCNCHAKCKC
ncbi:unnamed protein product [Trifolium pratense]|uniref:Uncharacterized protein n=1 Tax=Trifolium pratense TaxID=57577 RepID=A0ACB0M827_TRIPR|nr:unnamed protein product [Trifolium pratense]